MDILFVYCILYDVYASDISWRREKEGRKEEEVSVLFLFPFVVASVRYDVMYK